jgi:DNA-binding NarL/FixJ family response regulator
MVRVLVVEDHPIYRDGLAALLGSADIEVVGLATSGAEALALLETDPDVVIMDIGLPDRDGADLTSEVLTRRPATRVLVLTMFHDDSVIARALEAGASGYLVKDAPPDEVLRAVASVASGALVFGSDVAERVRVMTTDAVRRGPSPPSAAFPELRGRERQVLGMVAQGLDNAAIAERLGLSGKTVANYVSAILTRLHVRDRAAAAQLVHERTAKS